MRWPQFILSLINLAFSIYVIITTTIFSKSVSPLAFLWTLVYLTLSLAISHLYMLYLSNKIDDWYDVESMQSITNLSIVSLVVCLIALVVNISLEYYHHQKFLATDSESIKEMLPLVASLICSVVLFSSSIKFKKYVTLCRSDDMPAQTLRRNYRTTD
jgi:uncharacterized membrane protein